MLKRDGSKIFPPSPSELPDSSSTPSELAPSSEKKHASPNPQTSPYATESTTTDDAASDGWETVEKPDNVSLGAESEPNEEGRKIDSVDADVSVKVLGEKKGLADEVKEEGKIVDAGGNAEVKHGLLKDW